MTTLQTVILKAADYIDENFDPVPPELMPISEMGGKIRRAPYGLCPICGAPGCTRERQPNGNDTCCANPSHTYPSSTAIEVKLP